jgi:hypothetical protein
MALVEMAGAKLRLNQHRGQTQAWDSKRRFVFVIAGTQSGKTSWGPWWLKREMDLCGPGDYLAVTATYDLFKLKMLPEMKRVFCELLQWGSYEASDRVIVSHDKQSRIILRSANAPGGLESATAKAAWLDEVGQDDFRLESWEAVLRRLSLAQGRVLGTTTPYNLGWLKTEVFDRWRAGDPDYEVVQFKSTMNPAFPLAEYNRAKATLPGWKHRMFYDGEFTRPAGLIYEDYLDDYRENGGHLVKPFDIPAHWPRHVGLDFGAVNTALVWLAHDPDADIYYAYHESLDGGMTTPQHARRAKDHAKGVNVRTWHGGAKSETQQRMDWKAAGVSVKEPPIPDVDPGIDRVIALFKGFRLYVFDTLRGLRDELGTYSRKLDDAGHTTDDIKDKATFHRLDALRYVVQGVTHSGLPFAWVAMPDKAALNV